MDDGEYPGEIGFDIETALNKDPDEIETKLAGAGGGDAENQLSNGLDAHYEPDFEVQLNDLNRSPEPGTEEPMWSPTENNRETPFQNGTDFEAEDDATEDDGGGEGFIDMDADIATEGSLDLDVDDGGEIATEGSLDLDADVIDHQHLSDRYLPLGAEMDVGGSGGSDVEPPQMENPVDEDVPDQEPLLAEYQSSPDEDRDEVEEEQQQLLQDTELVDQALEAGAMTEGSLDLDVEEHVEDDDDDAVFVPVAESTTTQAKYDAFESSDVLESPQTYVNTTIVSNASSALEPAPAHAQCLIARSHDDVNGDVMAADSGRLPSGDEEITVIEPTTETKLLEGKGNGDVFMPMTVPRAGFPPPFPIGYNDENLHKGNWGHKMEFMCAIFCIVFNIDSFVQFPYLMWANGGVVFLIPYMIALFLLILPLVLIEISVGQFASASIFTCWRFCPLLKGLSIGMLLQLCGLTFIAGPFSSHSLFYIYSVFLPSAPGSDLVYATCGNDWNSMMYCRSRVPLIGVNGTNYTVGADYGVEEESFMLTTETNNASLFSVMPEEEYYKDHVKMQSAGTDDLGAPVTHLMICLGVSWIIAFSIILFGIKSLGKVAYMLVGAHVLLLFVLLIRGAVLDGAMVGIKALFWPEVDKLLDPAVWTKAFNCALYTFMPMCGIYMSLSSYNKFHNNCFMDSVVLILVALFANLLSAVTFFTYIGYGNQLLNLDKDVLHLSDHTTNNTIFILMAMLFSTLPQAKIMSFLLFFFSFLSSLSIQVVIGVSIVIGFLDAIGCRHSWKTIVPASLIVSLVCFGGGLLFITPEGPHFWMVLYKYFLPHIPHILPIIMTLALTWIYGTIPRWEFLKFQRDIKAMVGCFPVVFQGLFAGLEAIVIPLVIGVAWVFNLYLLFSHLDIAFEPYQAWHIAVAIIFAFVPLIIGFLSGAVMELCKYITIYRYFTELFWLAAIARPQWGPAVEEIRLEHNYAPIHPIKNDRVLEVPDGEFSHENVNNANENGSQRRSYTMTHENEYVTTPPASPREKQEVVFPDSNDVDHERDNPVNSNATLPAGTPLLGLSLCSHETTL